MERFRNMSSEAFGELLHKLAVIERQVFKSGLFPFEKASLYPAWTDLVEEIKVRVQEKRCGQFFSRHRQTWINCCYFKFPDVAAAYGFCISTALIGIDKLPVRRPEELFDVGLVEETLYFDMSRVKSQQESLSDTDIVEDDDPVCWDDDLSDSSNTDITVSTRNVVDKQTTKSWTTSPLAFWQSIRHQSNTLVRTNDDVPVFHFVEDYTTPSTANYPGTTCDANLLEFSCTAYCCDSAYRDSGMCSQNLQRGVRFFWYVVLLLPELVRFKRRSSRRPRTLMTGGLQCHILTVAALILLWLCDSVYAFGEQMEQLGLKVAQSRVRMYSATMIQVLLRSCTSWARMLPSLEDRTVAQRY